MSGEVVARRLEPAPGLTPEAALAAWPRERPVVALWSAADPRRGRWGGRWTVIGEPVGTLAVRPVGDGRTRAEVFGEVGAVAGGGDGLAALGDVLDSGRAGRGPAEFGGGDAPRFLGGWIGWMSYELGRVIEPVAGTSHGGQRDDRGWALAEWHRVPAAYVHDGWAAEDGGGWWVVGEREWVERLPGLGVRRGGRRGSVRLGALRSATGRAGYEAAVGRTVEHIAAGDIFQANIAHRLSAGFRGSARGMFARLAASARPWYGAYIERSAAAEEGMGDERRVICSISPELFLDFEGASRRVVTRPIKGTRPGDEDPAGLVGSGKDAAELTMIVDLMRNDLGRVAEVGSVRVEELRGIERHGWGGEVTESQSHGVTKSRGGGGVWHGVATVGATVRRGVGFGGLVRAAFPAGSITGAPKIRAMQIIGSLEPVERGPYCGSIGYVSDVGGAGDACLNVAIRTASIVGSPDAGCDGIRDGVLDYSVGAGIVAESDPRREWEETMHKAGAILGLAGGRRRAAGASA